jgi:hypothetical protein
MKKLFTLLLILVSFQAFSVKITMKVDMTDQDTTQGVYVTGHMTANETGNWDIKKMVHEGDMIFSWDTTWTPGDTLVYYFLTTPIWDNYLDFREEVPEDCDFSAELAGWDGDRAFIVPAKDTIVGYAFGTCDPILPEEPNSIEIHKTGKARVELYPNPANGDVTLIVPESNELLSVSVIDISGKVLDVKKSYISSARIKLQTSALTKGLYFIEVYNSEFSEIKKLIVR